jgi:TolB protein
MNGEIAYRVCTADLGGGCDIYVVEPDGSNTRYFLGSAYWSYHPAWAPHGGRLAFSGTWDAGRDSPRHIWIADAGGHNAVELTRGGQQDDWPAWSPDKTSIVFTRGMDSSQLFIKNIQTGTLLQLTHTPAGVRNAQSDWSPDGTRIVFSRYVNGNWDLYIKRLSDGHVRRLTVVAGPDRRPSWSPDGTSIAFQSSRRRGQGIWRIVVATGALSHLISHGQEPSWSPDGNQIAFYYGGEILRLTIGGGTSVVASAWGDPAWQPLVS